MGLGPPFQGLDIIFIPADVDAADAIDKYAPQTRSRKSDRPIISAIDLPKDH